MTSHIYGRNTIAFL